MLKPVTGVCLDCGSEYPTASVIDGLCPLCQAHEDAVYANDQNPEDFTPWRLSSRSAMREYLGVIGDHDE